MSKTKRLKKPTRAQKVIMEKEGLDWKNWYVEEESELTLTVVSKKAGRRRVLWK